LKGEVTAAADSITEETLAALMDNFNWHCHMVLDAQGLHSVYRKSK
jgi:hypothetical protein